MLQKNILQPVTLMRLFHAGLRTCLVWCVCVYVPACCVVFFSFPSHFFCSSKRKGCESKRNVSSHLLLLEQGGVRKQMTSCEKWEMFVSGLEEKFEGARGWKKGVRFRSKAPTQETSEVPVKNMPPLVCFLHLFHD